MENNNITGLGGNKNIPNGLPAEAHRLGDHLVEHEKSEGSGLNKTKQSFVKNVKALFTRKVEQTSSQSEQASEKADSEMFFDAIQSTCKILQENAKKSPKGALKSNSLTGKTGEIADQLTVFLQKNNKLKAAFDNDNDDAMAELLTDLKESFPKDAFLKMAVELQEKVRVDETASHQLKELTDQLVELTNNDNALNKENLSIFFNVYTYILPSIANMAFQWASEGIATPEKISRFETLSNFCLAMMGGLVGKAIDILIARQPDSRVLGGNFSTAALLLAKLSEELTNFRNALMERTNATDLKTTTARLQALKELAGGISENFHQQFFNGEAVGIKHAELKRNLEEAQKIRDEDEKIMDGLIKTIKSQGKLRNFLRNTYQQIKALV